MQAINLSSEVGRCHHFLRLRIVDLKLLMLSYTRLWYGFGSGTEIFFLNIEKKKNVSPLAISRKPAQNPNPILRPRKTIKVASIIAGNVVEHTAHTTHGSRVVHCRSSHFFSHQNESIHVAVGRSVHRTGSCWWSLYTFWSFCCSVNNYRSWTEALAANAYKQHRNTPKKSELSLMNLWFSFSS